MVAEIILTPANGIVGQTITIDGTGFSATEDITLTYGGAPLTPVAPISTDGAGVFTGTFLVPASVEGVHSVVATDETLLTDAADFTVEPNLVITEANITVGGTINATGTGFDGVSLMAFTFNAVSIIPVGGAETTDANGGFTAQFVVTAVPNGARTLEGTDAGANADSDTVIVDAKITLSPTTSSPGEIVTITGTGFSATEDIVSTFDTDPLTTVLPIPIVGANGSFSATFEVPVIVAGTYAVECTDESAKVDAADLVVLTVPVAPVLTIGTIADISLNVTCPEPADGDSAISGYTFEISADNFATILETISPVGAGAQDITFEDLTPATTYKIRARATNAIGTSANSNTITQATDSSINQMSMTLGGASGVVLDRYSTGETEDVVINSDTDMDVVSIPMGGIFTLLLHFKNPHETNDVTYTCYGSGRQTTTPPDFDTGVWEAITGITGTIQETANISKTITARYAWVLVRAKRTAAGQNTALSVYARGTKN